MRHRWTRGLALLLLLTGPLAAAEIAARRSLEQLYPYLSAQEAWPDTKALMLRRAGCPDVLALGSSITNCVAIPETMAGLALPFAGDELRGVQTVFTYGLPATRASAMRAVWRDVRRHCVPAYLLVEASPVVLNGLPAPLSQYAPYLDPPTIASIPASIRDRLDLHGATLARMLTWERLFVFRRRVELVRASLGLERPRLTGRHPRDDGRIGILWDGIEFIGDAAARERRKREALLRAGKLRYSFAWDETTALRGLVADATAAGARVVVHTPPTTGLYRRILDEAGVGEGWCDFYRAFSREPGVRWASYYGSRRFTRKHFADWVHLNLEGGRRYAELLFEALRDGALPTDPHCR
jgi:hypothetical protein